MNSETSVKTFTLGALVPRTKPEATMASVGVAVAVAVGLGVGALDSFVGLLVGKGVGMAVGNLVGKWVGIGVTGIPVAGGRVGGFVTGAGVGFFVVGARVGSSVGLKVGVMVNSLRKIEKKVDEVRGTVLLLRSQDQKVFCFRHVPTRINFWIFHHDFAKIQCGRVHVRNQSIYRNFQTIFDRS